MGKCETCKHWEPENFSKPYGTCDKITMWDGGLSTDPTAPLAYTQDASGYHSSLLTRPDFGCVLHTQKE